MQFWKKAPKVDRAFFLAAIALLAGSLILVGVRDATLHASSKDEEFYRFVDVAAEIYSEIQAKYVDDIEARRILEGALSGMFLALDEHSQYMDPDTLKSLEKDTSGEFSGIGINIGKRQNLLTVIAPIPGSPADEAGMLPWDRIIEIEGESTEGMDLQEAVRRLTGPAGTRVTFKVFRFGEPEPIEFTIRRANIEIKSVHSKLLEDNIGYIRIARFSENTTRDTRAALLEMTDRGMEGLILDLRFNSGGLLREAIETSDLFLEKGEMVVSMRGRLRGQNREYRAMGDAVSRLPIFVLVNEASASASEIVAGAIQDHRRGVVIGPLGKNTYGKGSVQTITPLQHSMMEDENGNPLDSALRLTTARYYTPSGRTIHDVGVTPDIGVPISDRHQIELLRHGLIGDPSTGEDYRIREPEPDEGTDEETPVGPVLQVPGLEEEVEVEEIRDPDSAFYEVSPPELMKVDDFVDIMLTEAMRQMRVYMELQRQTEGDIPLESLAQSWERDEVGTAAVSAGSN